MKRGAGLAIILFACASPSSKPVATPDEPKITGLVRVLAKLVAKARQIDELRVVVESADEQHFAAALAREARLGAGLPADPELGYLAEIMAEPIPDGVLAGPPLAVVFDASAKTLMVKSTIATTEPRVLFVREIARAILPKVKPSDNADTRLAQEAFVRGDAALAMLNDARLQQKAGPVSVSLAVMAERVRVHMGSDTDEGLLASLGESRKLLNAPLWVRERALFAGISGFAFAAALHRTEGFALLDKVHARPPVSTEQILHPELYLADERPVAIAVPRAPSGTGIIFATTLGELGMRAWFSECLPRGRARAAAEGWGGDIAVLAEKASDKSHVVAATSRWDSEDDAKEAESAFRELGNCWNKKGRARDIFLARRGNDVALTTGLAQEVAETEVVALLSLQRTLGRAQPPFGTKILAPPVALPEAAAQQRGSVQDGLYSHALYALHMRVPRGFETNTTLPGAELVLRGGTQNASSGIFTVSKQEWNDKTQVGIFSAVAAKITQQLGHAAQLAVIKDGSVSLQGSSGRQRSYGIEGSKSPLTVTVTLLPVCNNSWVLAFVSSSVSDADKLALQGWIESAQLDKDKDALPLCGGGSK